jgi:hypothetical protein
MLHFYLVYLIFSVLFRVVNMNGANMKRITKKILKLQISGALSLFIISFISFATPIQITIKYNSVIATLPAYYHGVNYSGFWDDMQGSVGSRNALKRAGVQLIRFPGGVPGDWYDWQNWSSVESKTSPKMLYDYATAIGAKVLFQTNAHGDGGVSNSASHAAGFLQYCIDNSMDVNLWEIGNEPEWWTGSIQPAQYYDIFNQQAPALKAKKTSITVMGCATANGYFNKVLLGKCPGNADALSFHWYGGGGWNIVREAAQTEWPSLAKYMHDLSTPPKPFYVTEWSPLGPGKGDVANDFNKQIGAAIAYADIIGAFTKSGVTGHFMFGCIHLVENSWGLLCGNGDYKPADQPGPTYFVLPLWTHMGNIVLGVNSNVDSAKVLSAYANKKSDNSVQVMIINKSAACSVSVAFAGYNPANASVDVYELKPASSASYTAMDVTYNGTTNPLPAQNDLPNPTRITCSGSTYTRLVPAYSITMIDFKNGSLTNTTFNRQIHSLENASRIANSRPKIILVDDTGKAGRVNNSLYDITGRRIGNQTTSALKICVSDKMK